MGYGDIIKRAWRITWRYRALWVLGLFAGVTGASSGGGSGGGNSYNPSSSGSGTGSGMGTDEFMRGLDPAQWSDRLIPILPVVIAGVILLVALGFVLWVLGIAARGGLIQAVDAIEETRPFKLGTAWEAGFSRFWRLLGLSLLLGFPMALLVLVLALALALPLLGTALRGADPNPAAFMPFCGLLVIGLPLLIVGSVILGSMRILGERSIMLDDTGVFASAGGAWRTFRARLKDTLIMWFINLGLNIAASIVVAIPMIIIVVAAVVPAVFSARSGSWTTVAVAASVAVLLITLLAMAYTAIWGTFTSALWTVFYRRLTGREVLAEAPVAPETPAVSAAVQPPAPPMVPQAPADPLAVEGPTS